MNMTHSDSYQDCLNAMYGLRRFGIILGLETTQNILKGLGNPHTRYQSIHVAGTNGKGSIASAVAAILQRAGYKVGLYTSPHLVHFNERIRINNQLISDGDVVRAYHTVRRASSKGREPTFFEFSTAMGFHQFSEHQVDWAVIETGMGGRLDATNIIRPAVSVISNISLEHRMYLGNTIDAVTREKAGIIKDKTPVITGVKQKGAISVVREIAALNSAPLFRLGDHFKVRKKGRTFTYYGIDNTWTDMTTGLLGSYQVDNAALTAATCELLNKHRLAVIDPSHIRAGLAENRWPGRMEIVSSSPVILLDGAHNLMASRNLADYLSGYKTDGKICLIIGILDDKPYRSMLKALAPIADHLILTRPETDRALPPERLYESVKKQTVFCSVIPSIKEAVQYAVDQASSNDMICIAGSLYVVGEAKAVLPDIL